MYVGDNSFFEDFKIIGVTWKQEHENMNEIDFGRYSPNHWIKRKWVVFSLNNNNQIW